MRGLEKGITLIALVIIIIILLILAGISLNTLLGENGIINRTSSAKIENEKKGVEEQLKLAVLASKINDKNDAKIDTNILKDELDRLKNEGIIDSYSPSNNFSLPATAKKGNYEFKIDEIGNLMEIETAETEKDWKETTNEKLPYSYGGDNVNAPKLQGDMKLVEYTGDLKGETNLWANAITSDGSMWVWIPRYAYKITSGYSKTKTHNADNKQINGTIEIKFIDAQNNFLDGTKETIKTDPTKITYTNGAQNEWLVHPAFTSNVANGGWDSELEGIWVGKFETTGEYNSSQGTGTLSVKPGNESLRNIKITDAYKIAKTSTFGEKISAENLGSHMAKNSEWGAVAYLAHSKYGTNGKAIGKNENPSHYTGGSDSETTIYTENKNQSTTGNATGVYDMNGGAWEFVANYVNWRDGATKKKYLEALNVKDQNNKEEVDSKCLLVINGGKKSDDLVGGSDELRKTSTKYKTVYVNAGTSNTDSMTSSYDANANVKGDAIFETSSGTGKVNSNNTTNSWLKQLSIFINFTHPFLKRGGNYDSNNTGTFFFNNADGAASDAGTFRTILAF